MTWGMQVSQFSPCSCGRAENSIAEPSDFPSRAGAETLAPCLQQLEEADLSSCGIGSQGAVALAVPVAAPASHLQVLRLGGNALGPAGAQALGPAIACSPALADLHLCDTDIQSQGASLSSCSRAFHCMVMMTWLSMPRLAGCILPMAP